MAKFDLMLEISEERLSLSYRIDLFCDSTAEYMLSHYVELIRKIIKTPDIKICDLEMMDDAERARIIEEFNNTDCPYPCRSSICSLSRISLV